MYLLAILFSLVICAEISNFTDFIEGSDNVNHFAQHLLQMYAQGQNLCLILGRGTTQVYKFDNEEYTLGKDCTWVYADGSMSSFVHPSESLGIRLDFNDQSHLAMLPQVFKIVAFDWSVVKFVTDKAVFPLIFNAIAPGGMFVMESGGHSIIIEFENPDDPEVTFSKGFIYRKISVNGKKLMKFKMDFINGREAEFESEFKNKLGNERRVYVNGKYCLNWKCYAFVLAEKQFNEKFSKSLQQDADNENIAYLRHYFNTARLAQDEEYFPFENNYTYRGMKNSNGGGFFIGEGRNK